MLSYDINSKSGTPGGHREGENHAGAKGLPRHGTFSTKSGKVLGKPGAGYHLSHRAEEMNEGC